MHILQCEVHVDATRTLNLSYEETQRGMQLLDKALATAPYIIEVTACAIPMSSLCQGDMAQPVEASEDP